MLTGLHVKGGAELCRAARLGAQRAHTQKLPRHTATLLTAQQLIGARLDALCQLQSCWFLVTLPSSEESDSVHTLRER